MIIVVIPLLEDVICYIMNRHVDRVPYVNGIVTIKIVYIVTLQTWMSKNPFFKNDNVGEIGLFDAFL